MADKTCRASFFSLLDGNYKVTGNWYNSLVVEGSKAVMKDPAGSDLAATFELGAFGEADPEVFQSTGEKVYNIKLMTHFGVDIVELGVVAKDGLKVITKGMMGISSLEWMTEEEAAALEADGDSIDAPPGPYSIQPGNPGKFLWITGAPGLGKSTSAQMLCRNAGYVYYEADCFGSCRNPYIPPDVQDPSMAQVYQKPLRGEGLEERKKALQSMTELFTQMMAGEEYDKEKAKEFYRMMSDDIKKERKRIGGDWAIAAVTLKRDLRDFIRCKKFTFEVYVQFYLFLI